MSEVAVARPVVAFLRDQGYEVHQEVAIAGGGSARADVVGVLGGRASGLLHVVEVKQAFTFDVIAQAVAWRAFAHHVSVAVPAPKRGAGRGRALALRLCEREGVGVLLVKLPGTHGHWPGAPDAVCVALEVPPRLSRRIYRPFVAARLRERLCDETLTTGEAGNADQRYHTPWRRTCDRIRAALAQHGPLTTRELVERVEHHYRSERSAIGSLAQWLSLGKVAGVELEPGSDPFRWRLAGGGR